MTIEVKVPQLPESVSDATLVSWHKKAGDSVRRDENLVDLETDKVVLEVPAPADGVLTEIRLGDGTVVTGGQILALLEPGEVEAETEAKVEAAAPTGAAAVADSTSVGDTSAAHKLSPAVRRLVEEHDLDASLITGSGKGGRINKADVMRFIDNRDDEVVPEDVPPTGSAVAAHARVEERVPMSRLRARIAERLVEAQATAAMLTTFNEVDLTNVNAIRARYKQDFLDRHGVKLGFMSFFVRAVCEALQKFPAVNSSLDGADVLYHNYQDIGVAVSSERGLMVPVLRDAGTLDFAQIEVGINELGTRVRDGSVSIEELTGGTFTISNGGIFGSMMSTPILNPPQSGILGMHNILQRPMVVDGEIVIRPMMYLALTYDHRIIDGRESVQFLISVKEALEHPERLLLGL